MRRLLNKRGQGTLEYLLILAGIIAALIVFKTTVQSKLTSALNRTGDTIETSADSAMDNLKLHEAW